MSDALKEEWLSTLSNWAWKVPSVKRAWVFGSRAKGKHTSSSDLDVAVLLDPEDGKILAEWILNAKDWRRDIQKMIGASPKVDLQHAWPDEDEIVWPAVEQHGILFYERLK